MEILSGRREKLLFLSITFLGISHIVTQLVAIREFLSIFHGNEIVFGIILANWMLLMGIGSYLGKFVKNVRGKMELLIVSQIGVAFLPFLLIFMVRAIKTQFFMFGVSADLIQIFSASLLILAPYGLLSGLLLTLACSVFKLRRTEEQIGSVYFIDNIGDILGGALFSFVLVFFLNSFQMAFVVFFINLLAALMLSGFLGRRTLAGFTLILLVASSALFFSFDLNMTTTRSMFPGQDVIYQKDTPYGNIVVTRTGNQLNFFENGLPLFSTENTMSNEETVHYAMIQHEIPKKVLLISGGVAGTLDEILKYDVERIDYVELDPRIIELGRLYTDNLNAEKINIINGDGRFFVKNAQDTYDVVIIDLPDPGTVQINRFYTLEFFWELKAVMNEDAVVSMSLSSSVNYMNPETVRLHSVHYNTLKQVFGNVIVIPGDDNFYVASDSELTYDIAQRIAGRNIPTLYVNENYLSGKITQDRIDYVLGSLERETALNTDFVPVTPYYHLLYWMSRFETNFLPLILIGAALLFVIVFFYRPGPIPISLATTGFAALALEIVILTGFQILYGYVYQFIGIIVTSFMIGLVMGAYYMNQRLREKKRKDMVKIELSIVAYSLILPLVLLGLSGLNNAQIAQIAFPLMTMAIAFLVGMEFPLASKLHLKGKDVEKTAGTLYASDLGGAFVGALLASAVLIPLLGIINVCILVGILNLVSGIVVWKK